MAAAAGSQEAALKSSASRTRCAPGTCLLYMRCAGRDEALSSFPGLCSVLVRVRPLLGNKEEQRCLEVADQHSIRIQAEREHLFSFDEVHSCLPISKKLAEPSTR